MKLGENVKRLRRDRGWTQGQLAKKVGMGQNQIYKIEKGTADPKVSTIYKLISALECSPNTLLMDPEEVGIQEVLTAMIERISILSEEDQKVLIKVLDNYITAEGFRKQFAPENNTVIRIWDEPPKPVLKDKKAS